MTRRLHWYKRNPQDWFNGTRDLTLEEKGAYNELLELLYLRDRPIPDDARFVANFLNVSQRRWKAIRRALLDAGRLVLRGDYLSDERFERERGQFAEFREKAQTWGHAGGKKRAEAAARDRQGQFALSEEENGGKPPARSKGRLGQHDENSEFAVREGKTVQNQGPAPRVGLDDLDDSFLHENPRSGDSNQFQTHLKRDSSATSQGENGGFPPPSSKHARVARAGVRVQNPSEEVRDSFSEEGSGEKRTRRGTRLPPDFDFRDMTDNMADTVAQWPPGKLEREFDRMKDWAAAKGETSKDWKATWRNWIRKADDDWQRERSRNHKRQGWGAVADRIAGQGR